MKKQKKNIYKVRRTWGVLNPVTRFKREKGYDRKALKRQDRRNEHD